MNIGRLGHTALLQNKKPQKAFSTYNLSYGGQVELIEEGTQFLLAR
jgi:hypothetical protein